MEEIKTQFLELLEDEDILKKLRKIISEELIKNEKINIPDESESPNVIDISKYNEEIEKQNMIKKELEEYKGVMALFKKKSDDDIKKLKALLKEKELEVEKLTDLEKKATLENKKLENINDENVKKIAVYEKTLNDQNQYISVLDDKNNKLSNEINDITRELTEYKDKTFEQNKIIDKINTETEIFEKYKNVSPETKDTLRGIFKEDTYKVFLACGTQRDNIDALWEVIRVRIMAEKFEDLDVLVEMLNFFIDVYNKTSTDPIFKMQEINIGEEYDKEIHTRDATSKPNGKVEKVLLPGYVTIRTDKIEKKSIVRLA